MVFNKLGNIFKGDKGIWMVFFFLAIISLIEVFSASSGLTYKSGSYIAPLIKHAGLLFLGFLACICMLNIPAVKLKRFTLAFYFFALILLVASLGWGEATNGANRWMNIAGIQFQPSEVMKGVLVWLSALVLSRTQTEKGASPNAFWIILILSLPPFLLIFKENFSTAALVLLNLIMMLLLGRVPIKQIGGLLGVILIIALLAFSFVMLVGKDVQEPTNVKTLTEQVEPQKTDKGFLASIFHRADTWKSRIDKFLDPRELSPSEVDLDKDAQVAHANIAIATSNIKGLGPGNSVERDFLSQAFSDFIYAIIIEELGIFGAAAVAFLYIILLYRAGVVARKCDDMFLALLAMGYALLLVTQAVFNMCVAVGLAPVTGQPLPLISKGGTSTIINCIYIGIILGVSRVVNNKEQDKENNKLPEKSN